MTDRTTEGPYEFTEPPAELTGWLQLDSAREFELIAGTDADPTEGYDLYLMRAAQRLARFGLEDITSPESLRIWDYAEQVTGKHLKTWRQLIGDCVSHGNAMAWNVGQVAEIARFYQEEKFRAAFPPYFYGMGRTAPDLGNGKLGNGDGSTGIWGAGAMRKYGCLFCDDQNVPTYSADVAKTWGRKPGPPSWARELAKDNLTGKTAKLTALKQVRHELINRRPVTMAIMYDFGMKPIEYKGHHVFKRGKVVGGHQVCLTEWQDEPFEGAYLQGSWGPNAHGRPLNGEQPGGAWVREADLDYHLGRGQYSEFFAMSLLQGHPGPANPSIL